MVAQLWLVDRYVSQLQEKMSGSSVQCDPYVAVSTVDGDSLSVVSTSIEEGLLGKLKDEFVLGRIQSYRNKNDRAFETPGIPIVVVRNRERSVHFSPNSEFSIRYITKKKPRSDTTGDLTIRLFEVMFDQHYSPQEQFVARVFTTYENTLVWPAVAIRPESGFGRPQYKPLVLFETPQNCHRWNGAATRPYIK